jgi:tRNA 2-thiouridine synthesizing protein E
MNIPQIISKHEGSETMTVIMNQRESIELDENGFLKNIHTWDQLTASSIAEREGVGPLSNEQMEIIEFMRSYYQKYNAFPILRAVCKNLHQPKECVNEQFIDPMKAWKIAGLPNPEIIATGAADEAGKIFRIIVGD